MLPTGPLQPFLRPCLAVVDVFPISLCPRGCLLSSLLGPLLWHLSSRLRCERHQVGELMPSPVRTVPTAEMEKGPDGDTGWVHRQVASDEAEELMGRGSPGPPESSTSCQVNVKPELLRQEQGPTWR